MAGRAWRCQAALLMLVLLDMVAMGGWNAAWQWRTEGTHKAAPLVMGMMMSADPMRSRDTVTWMRRGMPMEAGVPGLTQDAAMVMSMVKSRRDVWEDVMMERGSSVIQQRTHITVDQGKGGVSKGPELCVCKCLTNVSVQFECASTGLNSSICPESMVMHCTKGSEGCFHLFANARHVLAFVRVSGPTVQTLRFRQHRDASINKYTWSAPYKMCTAGRYFASVYLVLRDERPESVMDSESCVAAEFETPPRFNWTFDGQDAESCGWHWTWRNVSEAVQTDYPRVLSSYLFPRVNQSLLHHFSELRYSMPASKCSLAAFQTRPICLIGDSHMRNLANSIQALMNGQCDAEEMQKTHSVCRLSHVLYFPLYYPHEWRWNAAYERCYFICINVGQWSASSRSKPPWNLTRYSRGVGSLVKVLDYLVTRRHVLHVVWLSTLPHTIDKSMVRCPPTDWRFPHFIEGYNSVARKEVASTAGRVAYLDLYKIAFNLFDVSYDGAHYQGPVGAALATALLNHLLTSMSAACRISGK
ncbi:hypothetical protein GUITHDRAFT_142555 [Guillardia theta CCMP2712]|uniref:SGNH domain-containing protein n=1 Tax=Guillardia theta (strain CCMP2712) TaxID=905079 RepID=L1IWR0_GUITC|nr:hypothetical protein GUITHDRAFT_142555 [Guillardia theta CCMP2712]EKX40681.1 hypothetical protein GUITHDRAFT_142555 [Guillardia theta CCMP2712]|eukprot:XP_005827661.1 hypothetical protein GUITHDRAFT_142555 [Guillardia theta CCMP2712]